MIQFYEGVIYRENFEISPVRKVIGGLFASRQIYKNNRNELMQALVKMLLIALYGVQLRKVIKEL